MESGPHPTEPHSNVPKLADYDPTKYALDNVSLTVLTHEDLIPNRPPCLTQYTIGQFLQPLTRELAEVPLKPTIDELPDSVVDRMLLKDKAFWVDKPGANAYTMQDTYTRCGMKSESVRPPHQDVFPRSYQYDLDCVQYRRHHACDKIRKPNPTKEDLKLGPAHCRIDCHRVNVPCLSPFLLSLTKDPGQLRWRDYPDLRKSLTRDEIRQQMDDVGRPFKSEACNWYNEHYPSAKFDVIVRKFSK